MNMTLPEFQKIPFLASAVAAMAVLVTGTLASADEHNRRWSATGAGVRVVAADCTACGDDIGMMISCKGAGQPVEVTVHWAAVEKGEENAVLPLVLEVGGETFERQATTTYFGQIGYTPQFSIATADPLFEALQAGSEVRISFAGEATTIELKGSRNALDQFRAQCD